jgi:hypothetical protein
MSNLHACLLQNDDALFASVCEFVRHSEDLTKSVYATASQMVQDASILKSFGSFWGIQDDCG